ncbi:hypothetical protein LVD15_01885 [Fulvivirga maritima]|uniref:hypothetical protein n=1 Tax=Fulvivirga maritima TaxID=2904247 RepID=UPI001F3BA768|nr:hypothetical protein [Fulvivirga maritima]UII27200.1 hypothetical protein LVD15_01885 [Fulvivirga maritima]
MNWKAIDEQVREVANLSGQSLSFKSSPHISGKIDTYLLYENDQIIARIKLTKPIISDGSKFQMMSLSHKNFAIQSGRNILGKRVLRYKNFEPTAELEHHFQVLQKAVLDFKWEVKKCFIADLDQYHNLEMLIFSTPNIQAALDKFSLVRQVHIQVK